MIRADGVCVTLAGTRVLDGVSLSTGPGMLGIVGPNGSGKSTLLRTLYAGLEPDSGQVELNGSKIRGIPRRQVARDIAVVVQESPGDIGMRVRDLVMLGRLPHQRFGARDSAADLAAVESALSAVGAVSLAGRDFSGLSGGEKQRVLIARGLAQGATHLLLDEPTNHLDIRYQHELLELLTTLSASVTVVLHDLNLAARYCARILLLDSGVVTADGTPAEVLTPARLEPVFGIGVSSVLVGDRPVLAFHRKRSDPAPAGVAAPAPAILISHEHRSHRSRG